MPLIRSDRIRTPPWQKNPGQRDEDVGATSGEGRERLAQVTADFLRRQRDNCGMGIHLKDTTLGAN